MLIYATYAGHDPLRFAPEMTRKFLFQHLYWFLQIFLFNQVAGCPSLLLNTTLQLQFPAGRKLIFSLPIRITTSNFIPLLLTFYLLPFNAASSADGMGQVTENRLL